jgi:hypothetical protein
MILQERINDPYYLFDVWLRTHGFTDVADCQP